MKNYELRNFSVRFRDTELRRIETTAKPFYGGRMSTGEAIRRLAEERLHEIESKEAREHRSRALLRILDYWRSGRVLPIADLRLIADSANAAYRCCRADFVTKGLVIANVSAFRDAMRRALEVGSGDTDSLASRYCFGDPSLRSAKIGAKSLLESVDKWIAGLPHLVTAPQAESASRNLIGLLRDEDCPDEGQLERSLRPYLPLLLQVAIRAHWYQEHRALVGAEEDSRHTRPANLSPVRHGVITLKPIVRAHELTLAMVLPNDVTVAMNNFVEVQDLCDITRLALEGQDVGGDAFRWCKQSDKPKQIVLSTERGSFLLKASDLISVAHALDALFREPSIAGLAERGRLIYGRI